MWKGIWNIFFSKYSISSCLFFFFSWSCSIPSVIKAHGAHLKASAAMVRLRLYDILALLPPKTYEGMGCFCFWLLLLKLKFHSIWVFFFFWCLFGACFWCRYQVQSRKLGICKSLALFLIFCMSFCLCGYCNVSE